MTDPFRRLRITRAVLARLARAEFAKPPAQRSYLLIRYCLERGQALTAQLAAV